MSGFDLLAKSHPIHSMLFLPLHTDHYAIKAIRFSAIDYLLKPVDVTELENAVKRFLEKRERPSMKKGDVR